MRTDFLHTSADATSKAEEVIRPRDAMAIKVSATDPEYLKGTYSKAFVSEMAIQLTSQIENHMLVSGIAKSDIFLEMIFAPGMYFEHPQGEYTYRRLLISENGRAVKDLWVRWHRLGGGENFTACDDVSPEEIRFSLGEDVPQKVREKEYRFLVRADAEKYRIAMGRKNVTEWREIIKRALKRGALQKLTIDDKVAEHAEQIKDKLEELLGKINTAPAPEPAPAAPARESDEAYEKAMAYMRSFVEGNKAPSEEAKEERETVEISEEPAVEVAKETAEAFAEDAAQPIVVDTEIVFADEPLEEKAAESATDTKQADPLVIELEDVEVVDVPSEEKAEEAPAAQIPPVQPSASALDLSAMRAEMEAKLRAEMAAREQALLQKEQQLEQQRRAFAAELKEQETSRIERENELRRQAQNQARLEWEAKERDRLAAQAREAIELRKAEEARLAEEARKAEEARLAEEARKAEEARLAEEAQKEETSAVQEEELYTYTEKLVHLIFRYPVDPNVLTRIQELMTDTIRYFKKENVFIKVKASIPKEDTVDLHFTQFPEQEHQLLVDMIQVLGNSDLGICRVRVE